MIDIDSLFESFTKEEIKVNYKNKNELIFFFKGNIAQIVYVDNGKRKMVVVTANKEMVNLFRKKSTVTRIFESATKKITKKTSNQNSLQIKCFDFIKEEPWSIPLDKRWKVIRYVPITEKNMEELNDRMHGVFEANKNTKNVKDKNKGKK